MFKRATILISLVTTTMTADVENRKKLDYHIFTCKFPISYITMSAEHDIVMM